MDIRAKAILINFLYNHSTNNFDDGFDEGGEENFLFLQPLYWEWGIRISSFKQQKFFHNTGNENGFAGFHIISCTGCTLLKNTASKNFKFNGEDPGDGIQLDFGATKTLDRGNKMKRNEGIDAHDLNENCDENKWKDNTFNTSEAGGVMNPQCIQ